MTDQKWTTNSHSRQRKTPFNGIPDILQPKNQTCNGHLPLFESECSKQPMKIARTLSGFAVSGMFCCIAIMATGCATYREDSRGFKEASEQDSIIHPAYASVTIPTIEKNTGNARVFFYYLNPNNRPAIGFFRIFVDDRGVGLFAGTGSTAPGFQGQSSKCLFVDHPAGSCKVTVAAPPNIWGADPPKELTLNLVPGETRYIQIKSEGVSFTSTRVILMADPGQAVQDLNQCVYVGPSLSSVPQK